MARLQQHYREKIAKDLTEKFGYKSPMQVPASPRSRSTWAWVKLSPTRRFSTTLSPT
jgi:hypothetical protein